MIFSLPIRNDGLRYYYRRVLESLALYPALEGVSVLPVDADSFEPAVIVEHSEINIGVYLPENGQITSACINPQFTWDMIIVPSLWLEYQLKIRGITNVVTVLPGYDVQPPGMSFERVHDGKFVVVTSGRLSLHQGHDLILAAMRRFMKDHQDCWFACDWELTRHDLEALRASPYCDIKECVPWDRHGFLEHNGIDTSRVLTMPDVPERDAVWGLVTYADLCVAPVRALLGTDLTVAACRSIGKVVIAFEPLDGQPLLAPDGITVWFEPTVSVILDRMETEYSLWRKGHTTSPYLPHRSWTMAADELYQVIVTCFEHHTLRDKSHVSAFTWNKRGAVFAELGLYEASFENYRNALNIEPFNAETYNCIGNLLDMQERYQEALLYFDKALNFNKRFAAAYFNKGTTLKKMQLLDDAIEAYQRALQIDPQFVMGWLNLAIAFAMNKQEDKADECFRKTVELDPCNTDALFLWGNQLLAQCELEHALDCYQRVLALEPEHYLACNSMGITYLTLMEAEKAYNILHTALMIKPDLASAMTNMGTACRELGRIAESIDWYDRVLELEPEEADTRWNRSLALLHDGNYREGWQEYEWRFKKTEKIIIPSTELPRWNGEDLKNKIIFVQAEQGYGDTIHFMRYVKVLAARGARVIVECQDANVQSVVSLLPELGESIVWKDKHPTADFTIPLLSLPFALGTTVESIPFAAGYLEPPVEKIQKWRSIIDAYATPGYLRVGFVWDGRKSFRNDKRSISLQELMPLLTIEGVDFISLQKGEQANQLKTLQFDSNIIDITDQLTTFADTAALIAGLDLVISVDTSVVHVAGAVGCPTWIMLKVGHDWRWLNQKTDSPWYTSVKLYHQREVGEWGHVIELIGEHLRKKCLVKKMY